MVRLQIGGLEAELWLDIIALLKARLDYSKSLGMVRLRNVSITGNFGLRAEVLVYGSHG